ncbi:conserved hypothetical protein [Coccidioides posadasii str. Silveira]|uniref:Uncharacterized protein n=2 Tax=Coccidioides posadasii TaxID=199306 RepID=E9D6N7_COCPS|nr:conserved hypothetical protein [Coccidioides posadasii str. Silveira]
MAQISSGQDTTMTNLDDLHRNLVAPTKQQEEEQAFALTAEQYNALTTLDDDEGDITPQPSNLQQAYAAMRSQNTGIKGTSEVYSRSLLWDRVPEKVIRDFRRMVKDCGIPGKHEEPGGAMCTS